MILNAKHDNQVRNLGDRILTIKFHAVLSFRLSYLYIQSSNLTILMPFLYILVVPFQLELFEHFYD